MSAFRHLAPAGTPISLRELGGWVGRLVRGGDHVAALTAVLRDRFGLAGCVPTATGRAGLLLILRALARIGPSSRNEVVIPSYTCYTVAASVVLAGLRPHVVDIDVETLDFAPPALARVDFSRVLAIVPTNLFGLPSNLPYLQSLARQHGVRLVDDAAQAMGAEVGGRLSGTWGDAGLFSLDKGKNITTMEGGLVVTTDPANAAALDEEARALAEPGFDAVARDAVKLLAYAAFLRPWLYGIPNSIPQLGLGATRYTPTIALERYNNVLAAMGLVMLDRLDAMNDSRRAVAAQLDEAVAGAAGVSPIRVLPGSRPGYLRYPLVARDEAQRNALRDALNSRGVGATGSYPTSIVDIPELITEMARYREASPNGRAVASRILTLPTHAYVSATDIVRIRATIGEVAGRPTARPTTLENRLA
jgi:perosamine synthetase